MKPFLMISILYSEDYWPETEKNLKDYSAAKAIDKLGQIKMIKNRLGDKVFYQSIQPNKEHNMILNACEIPPIPKTFFKEQ